MVQAQWSLYATHQRHTVIYTLSYTSHL